MSYWRFWSYEVVLETAIRKLRSCCNAPLISCRSIWSSTPNVKPFNTFSNFNNFNTFKYDFKKQYVKTWHCTKKWSFPLRISSVNVTKFAGLVTFTEKILNGKFHSLCSVKTQRVLSRIGKCLDVRFRKNQVLIL